MSHRSRSDCYNAHVHGTGYIDFKPATTSVTKKLMCDEISRLRPPGKSGLSFGVGLGSIEHLQHYFTKTGLVSNRECISDSPLEPRQRRSSTHSASPNPPNSFRPQKIAPSHQRPSSPTTVDVLKTLNDDESNLIDEELPMIQRFLRSTCKPISG